MRFGPFPLYFEEGSIIAGITVADADYTDSGNVTDKDSS